MSFLHQMVRVAFMAAFLSIGLTLASGQAEPDQLFDINELKKSGKPPQAIRQGAPVYPYTMSRAGVSGEVTVSFIINTKGNVSNAYAIKSNNPSFERPAIDAILKWKFQPGELNGRPVNTLVRQIIEFNLGPADFWRVSKGKDHDKLPPEFQWDSAPIPEGTTFPVYPLTQLKARIAGRALISYVVGPEGRVVSAKLQEATAPEFGQAVLATIDAWQFIPAKKKDGTPAYASLSSEYNFVPDGRSDVPVDQAAQEILRTLEKKPESIATLKELDQPLKPRSRRPPVYPSALLKAGQPGEATIEFFVDKNGDAQLPRIVSSTATEFGYAAVQAVATWRFEPARRGGKGVIVRAQIPISFSLPDDRPAAGK